MTPPADDPGRRPVSVGDRRRPGRIRPTSTAMTAVSLELFRRGHLPVMGEWFALPLIEAARRRGTTGRRRRDLPPGRRAAPRPLRRVSPDRRPVRGRDRMVATAGARRGRLPRPRRRPVTAEAELLGGWRGFQRIRQGALGSSLKRIRGRLFEVSEQGSGGEQMSRLVHQVRDDDRRGGSGAGRRAGLFRRCRAAEYRGQPRQTDRRARPRAGLRGRRVRRPASPAPAASATRRSSPARPPLTSMFELFALLPARRPDRRRLPGRGADRPLRQHQHHGDR